MRGVAAVVYLFVFNGIGLSLGPALFAALTDYAFGDEALLWRALAVGAPALALAAAAAAFAGLAPYRACVADLAAPRTAGESAARHPATA